MRHLTSNDEFYKALDAMCERLRNLGMTSEAERLSHRLHKVTWTTSSELFDEVAEQLESLKAGPNADKLDKETRREVDEYLALISER